MKGELSSSDRAVEAQLTNKVGNHDSNVSYDKPGSYAAKGT